MKQTLKDQILALILTMDYQVLNYEAQAAALSKLVQAAGYQAPDPTTQKWRTWVNAYTTWYTKRTNGIKARTTSGDLKALKEIAVYLTEANEGDQDKALAAFNQVLNRWPLLSEWMQKQVGLTSINKHLTEIIEQIRTHDKATGTNQAQRTANDFRDRFK